MSAQYNISPMIDIEFAKCSHYKTLPPENPYLNEFFLNNCKTHLNQIKKKRHIIVIFINENFIFLLISFPSEPNTSARPNFLSIYKTNLPSSSTHINYAIYFEMEKLLCLGISIFHFPMYSANVKCRCFCPPADNIRCLILPNYW